VKSGPGRTALDRETYNGTADRFHPQDSPCGPEAIAPKASYRNIAQENNLGRDQPGRNADQAR
jgi:hypothetical protein